MNVPAPAGTAWHGIVTDVRLYLHQFRSSVGVRRFATGADADLVLADGTRRSLRASFSERGAPAALGFEFETDGVAVDVRLPTADDLSERAFEPALERAVTTGLLRRLVAVDPDLPRELNGFGRSWLRQVMVCAAGRRALVQGRPLGEVALEVAEGNDLTPFDDVLDALLGIQGRTGPVPTMGALDQAAAVATTIPGMTAAGGSLDRLKGDLRDWLQDSGVRLRLAEAVRGASARDAGRGRFIRRCLNSSLADCVLAGVAQMAPRQAAADALLADFEQGDEESTTIWVTETTLGGAGVVQAAAGAVALEPRTLFRAVEASLEASDLETASVALMRTARLATADPLVRSALAAMRAEEGHEGRARARRQLLALLEERGVEVGRAFSTALSIRLAAPGTNPVTDQLLVALLDAWDHAEETLGISLDIREVAVLVVLDPAIEGLARGAGIITSATPLGERVDVLAGLLWPRSDVLRREGLATWSPYRPSGDGDPAILRAVLFEDGPAIRVDGGEWATATADALARLGAVRLASRASMPAALRTAMLRMQTMPVHIGYLRLYPSLERITRTGEDVIAAFVLRERI